MERLTFKSLVVTLITTGFNIKKSYVLHIVCIFVLCMDLRTNGDFCPVQQ